MNSTNSTTQDPPTRSTEKTVFADSFHLSNKVIFSVFFGFPVIVGFLYCLWKGMNVIILCIDGEEATFDTENDYDSSVKHDIDGAFAVAPILSKLPPDYVFPPYKAKNEECEIEMHDIALIGKLSGSLIRLPCSCKESACCPYCREKSTTVCLPEDLGEGTSSDQGTSTITYSDLGGSEIPETPPRPARDKVKLNRFFQ